jgi:hypothetical protein
MPLSNKPSDGGGAGAGGGDDENVVESSRNSSMECYETCEEESLSPVAMSFWDVSETESVTSSGDAFYSARSSLNL